MRIPIIFTFDFETAIEFKKRVPKRYRSKLVEGLVNHFIEIDKVERPEGKNPSSFAENQQSMVSEETKEVSDIV